MATQLQATLAAVDERCPDRVIRAKSRGLLRGYHARWRAQAPYVLEIESTITSDLFNPATSAKSRSFIMAGKEGRPACKRGALSMTRSGRSNSETALVWRPPWRWPGRYGSSSKGKPV
jgi:hypothetical protein